MTNLKVLRDLTHQSLEGQFTNEELGGLLVSPDLAESDGSWTKPMGFLHSSSDILVEINVVASMF